jgi:hypothetical protein
MRVMARANRLLAIAPVVEILCGIRTAFKKALSAKTLSVL